MSRGEFSVRFWGVRGSMATASSCCSGVGGNTSCVEVRVGDQLIILDAGTGLHNLGETLSDPVKATFLFSHFHWDHIQGFPFFAPLYSPGSRIAIAGPSEGDCGPRAALENLMAPPHFPVRLDDLAARCTFRSIRPGGILRLGPVTVTAARMNHRPSTRTRCISCGSPGRVAIALSPSMATSMLSIFSLWSVILDVSRAPSSSWNRSHAAAPYSPLKSSRNPMFAPRNLIIALVAILMTL